MKSSKVKEVTYLDVPHKVQTYSFQSNATGKRVFVRKNIETSDIESKDVMDIVNQLGEKYFHA